MSSTYKKLGIEYTQFSKDQIDDALSTLQSSKLEQVLVTDCEQFEWKNLIEKPELVECIDPNQMSPHNFKLSDDGSEDRLARNSFFLFTQESQFRLGITKFVEQANFKLFMLIAATANMLAFCLNNDNNQSDTIHRISIGLEVICNCAFGLEIILKSIAYGFVLEPNTYLREKWNVINVIAFLTSWIVLRQQRVDESTLVRLIKTVRLLRVFRFLQEIPVLRIQLDAYLGSFINLGAIIVPLIFVMLYFSVVGLHLFMGLTEYRCRMTPEPINGEWLADDSILKLCGIWDCPENRYCGSPADYGLPRNETENDYEAFTWNFTRFDDFFYSLFVVFTFLNVTGWSGTTFMYWKSMTTYITATYFLILIVLLAFILSNLLLATFYESFIVQSSIKQNQNSAKQEELQIEDEIQRKKQQQMMDRLAAMSKKRKKRTQINTAVSSFSLYFDQTLESKKNLTRRLSNLSNQLSKSVYFIIVNCLVIIMSSVAIVYDYNDMPDSEKRKIEIIDFICTIYFFIEIVIQILGKGFYKYLNKTVNKLDILVILSQVILFSVLYSLDLNIIHSNDRIVDFFKAFKIFRLLKFLYSAKLFYNISILTRCALETILKLKHILLLWLSLVLFLALIGKELLGDINLDQNVNIYFSDFGSSLMASFNVFYNEEWHITMYRYARITPLSIVFYVFAIVFGQVFFIRLLTAVFLNEFGKQLQTIEQSVKPVEYKKAAKELFETLRNFKSSKPSKTKLKQSISIVGKSSQFDKTSRSAINRNLRVNKRLTKIQGDFRFQSHLVLQQNDDIIRECEQFNQEPQSKQSEELIFVNQIMERKDSKDISVILKEQSTPVQQSPIPSPQDQQGISSRHMSRPVRMAYKILKSTKSFYVFHEENYIRIQVTKLIETNYYKYSYLFIILITSIRIALVNPLLDPNSDLSKMLDIIQIITTVYYTCQIILNTISYGFLFSPTSYIQKSPYNILNFIVTISELTALSTTPHKIFNFLTSLRILEFLKIGADVNSSIRYAQSALLNAFVKMIQLSLFFFVILLIYGTFAMKLLKGYNYSCYNVDSTYTSYVDTKWDCYDYGGSWVNSILTFDNVFDSGLTLFITATTEAWLPILVSTWSERGKDLIPINNHNRWWAVYFQLFFFIGNICMLNMFIGLIVNTYQEAKLKAQGLFELDENQREWYRIKQSIYKLIPKVKSRKPNNKFKRFCFFLVKNKTLKKFWLIVIFINTLTLCLYFHRQEYSFQQALNIINGIAIILQTTEILSRFIAKTLSIYFKEVTNLIDILGIWVCLTDIFIINMVVDNFYFERCFKAFSVAFQMTRNFRIVKRFNKLETLFHSIFSVIPSALSIIYIMFIFLFIYTNLGMDMFAYLKPQEYINGFDLHFQKFTTAMFSLVRVASSEQWWALLVDAVHTRKPNFACLYIETYDEFLEFGFNGCGTEYAYLFFVSFHLIFSLVILNLFIASLLGAYEEHVKQELSAISKYQLDDVLNLWAQYDPLGEGFLNYKQFWKLSSEVALVFGVSQADLLNPSNKQNFLKALNIQLYEDKNGLLGYLFHDVILNLTKISVTLKYGVQNLEAPQNQLQISKRQLDDRYKNYTPSLYNSGHMGAIIYLQQKVRVLLNRKKGGKFLSIEAIKKALEEMEKQEKASKN